MKVNLDDQTVVTCGADGSGHYGGGDLDLRRRILFWSWDLARSTGNFFWKAPPVRPSQLAWLHPCH